MVNLKVYYLLRLINAHIDEKDLLVTSNRLTIEIGNKTLIKIEKVCYFLKNSNAESITFEEYVTRKEDGEKYNALFTCNSNSWGIEILQDDEKLKCKKAIFPITSKRNIAYLE